MLDPKLFLGDSRYQAVGGSEWLTVPLGISKFWTEGRP